MDFSQGLFAASNNCARNTLYVLCLQVTAHAVTQGTSLGFAVSLSLFLTNQIFHYCFLNNNTYLFFKF